MGGGEAWGGSIPMMLTRGGEEVLRPRAWERGEGREEKGWEREEEEEGGG